MEDLTGRRWGPYQIVGSLGEGGMAAVYKAYQPGMDRYVALKVLPKQLAKEPEFVGRFEQEAKVLAKLQHPHILPIFDYGEAEGYTYIVMPFVKSGTLADLMQGHPLPEAQFKKIVSQVGDALDYAHGQGLVHRDIKPSNILLDERGNCMLTDFGIAKLFEATSSFTQTGGIIGTPAYMSPEQGQGEKIDGRSDIYSLGIILYEMATGRVPFQAETPIAVVFKHIQDPLPMPRSINPNLSESVEAVILKSVAKKPEDRFFSAGEMVRTLQATLTYSPVSVEPPSDTSLISSPITAEKTPALTKRILAILALIVIIGTAGLWAILARGRGEEPDTTPGGVSTQMVEQEPVVDIQPSFTPLPTLTVTEIPTPVPTDTPMPMPTPTLESFSSIFSLPDMIHLGDEELDDWPPLIGNCFTIGFELDGQVTQLILEVDASRSEVESPVYLDDILVTILPPTGDRFSTDWVQQTVSIPGDGLEAGQHRLSICTDVIEDNPDFPGDVDDYQLRNISLSIQR